MMDRAAKERPCGCVLRAIFRACYAKFRRCADRQKSMSRVALEADPKRMRRSVWGMKSEEYLADFCGIAKRVLGEGTLSHKLFVYHFLLGADWQACSTKLGLNRGEIFHEVYRVQTRLGRAYRETRPYGLFPIDEYFGGGGGDVAHRAPMRLQRSFSLGATCEPSIARLRPPLKEQ